MKLFFAFIAFSVFAGVSAASIASTTASAMKVIMDDFTELAHLYADTVTALDKFPGSGSQGAARIHDNEVNIENIFQDVNNHLAILPQPVSQKNAEKIINTYQSFVPVIIESLNDIAAKSADFMKMNAATTMSDDVALAVGKCAVFAGSLIAMTPASMMNDVNNMFTELTAAREGASAALANVLSA